MQSISLLLGTVYRGAPIALRCRSTLLLFRRQNKIYATRCLIYRTFLPSCDAMVRFLLAADLHAGLTVGKIERLAHRNAISARSSQKVLLMRLL